MSELFPGRRSHKGPNSRAILVGVYKKPYRCVGYVVRHASLDVRHSCFTWGRGMHAAVLDCDRIIERLIQTGTKLRADAARQYRKHTEAKHVEQ